MEYQITYRRLLETRIRRKLKEGKVWLAPYPPTRPRNASWPLPLSLPWRWRPTPTIPHSAYVSCTMPCHCSVGQEKGNNSSENETTSHMRLFLFFFLGFQAGVQVPGGGGVRLRACLDAKNIQNFLYSTRHIESLYACMEH
jgi:hypothetical protein